MKNRIILAFATVLILAVGLTAGSHIFESTVNIPLSADQEKLVSLPYTCSFTTAQLLRNDIMAAAGYTPPYPFGIVNVYNWNGTAWQRYAGGGVGQVNFVITPGMGYKVKSTADVTTWNVTGTHNPATYITFAANTRKVVSIPYESPSTTASLLRNEIVAAGGTGVSVYNWDGMAWQRWSGGGIGQLDFEIVPGTGYVVKSTSDVAAWYPASN
ncbi:MAG TPA: hypothetical protein PKJ37_07695 [Acidobacteriota bacterium]|nr:hypothetical protein [Acidobacteriota bacterium]HNT17756.1 hypothetical protein [Acidobacteriota bacterium]